MYEHSKDHTSNVLLSLEEFNIGPSGGKGQVERSLVINKEELGENRD